MIDFSSGWSDLWTQVVILKNINFASNVLNLLKGLFTRNVFQPVSVIATVNKCVLFYCHHITGQKVIPLPILSVIHIVIHRHNVKL